ncbi:GyrI-like domain-containing protein [Sphingomonas sp. LT1P40]|uniref:GyrI-like domain-containing protein n=1 Tax=Alteristakelama amylovorans TaxID=3096166 RepID=UPI002FC94030
MTPRFQRGGPLRIAGLRRTHIAAKLAETTRKQWIELIGLGPIPGQRSQVAYGVFCGDHAHPGQDRFDYLTGVEIALPDPLPSGRDAIDIPATHYAVFAHDGHVRDMRALWPKILTDWLPANRLAPGPRFERYGESFDPVMASGPVEIWVPVATN